MTTKNLIGRIALALAACSPALIANGAQTGSLVGVVKDQKGSPVAGAQVRVSAPTLMGTRVFVASSTGEFRGLMLPPGSDYTLTVTAPGFQTVTLPSRVQVNQPTAISVTMVPASGAVVEVVANSTILDTKAVGAQANYTAEANDRFPVNRTYQDLMGLAAGVQAYQNPMALGGRSTENAYLVDGVDTTDPSMGTFSLNLNEEAIQEVQVLTTGVSAEYGRFSGAVSNVVTKSGSNEFQGSIRYEFSNVGWNANKPYAPTPGMNYVDTPFLSLSGPIVKDKLWIFASAQIPSNSSVQTTMGRIGEPGVSYDRKFKADPAWYSVKLTWQINQDHLLALQATGDPAKINAKQYGNDTDYETTTWQKQGGNFMSLTYRGVLSPTLALEAQAAQQKSELILGGNGGQKWTFYDMTDQFVRQYENGTYDGYVKRPRTQFNTALTWLPEAAGHHEIKVGLDFQDTKSSRKIGPTGDNEVYFSGFLTQADVRSLNYNMDANSFLANYTHPVEATSKNKYTALYLNDKWQLNTNWSFNLGGRYEKGKGSNDLGQQIWDFSTFSPRLGVTFDWKGEGKESLGLFFARYYQSPWQDALDKQNRTVQTLSIFPYMGGDPHSRDSYLPFPVYQSDPSINPYIQFDPKLKPSYADEWTLSYKRQFTRELSYQGQLVSRDYKNQLVNYTYYSGVTPDTRTTRLQNAPDAQRTYKGFLNTVEFNGDKWYAMGTWTMSKIQGDIDASDVNAAYGSFFQGTYTPAINQNRAYGYLSNDQTHIFRVLVARKIVLTPTLSLDNGFRFGWYSGYAYSLTASRYDVAAPGYVLPGDTLFTQHLGDAGSHRSPSYYRLDYSATLNWQASKKLVTGLKVKVTNLLNTFKAEGTDTTMSYDEATHSFIPGPVFGQSKSATYYQDGRTLSFAFTMKF